MNPFKKGDIVTYADDRLKGKMIVIKVNKKNPHLVHIRGTVTGCNLGVVDYKYLKKVEK